MRKKIPQDSTSTTYSKAPEKFHMPSCHELQSSFWEFSQGLAFFLINKTTYHSWNCLITGMQAIAASFSGQRMIPGGSHKPGVYVSFFIPHQSCPAPDMCGERHPQISSIWPQASHTWTSEVLPPLPHGAHAFLCLEVRAKFSEDLFVWTWIL